MTDGGRESASYRPSARAQVRRRLLQGAFAVPAVVPMSSGAWVAAGSTLTCFNNSPATESSRLNPNPSQPLLGGVAWAVAVYTVGTQNVFRGNDLVAWANYNQIDIDPIRFASPANKLYLASTGADSGIPDPGGDLGTPVAALSLALVYERYKLDGRTGPWYGHFIIVGVGTMAQVSGQHVMWGTCWSSMAVPAV